MAQRKLCLFDKRFSDLAAEFNIHARVTRVGIPQALYDEFIRLYRRSENLYEKLEGVMNDGEHQLIMEEGRMSGLFDLPADDYLEEDMRNLKACLKAFNPYHVQPCNNGRVKLHRDQIDGFFNLFAKDYDVFHNVAEVLRHTDYLDYHRHLRDVQKVKYAGPTSLREIIQVYFGIARAQSRQKAYLAELSAVYS